MTLRVAIHGIAGRMGRAVARVLAEHVEEATLVAGFEREGSPYDGADFGAVTTGRPSGLRILTSVDRLLGAADVVIDFSTPAACAVLLRACAASRTPAVIGTTGLDDEALIAVGVASAVAPVVVAPNMSPGVNVLFHLATRATRLLGPSFDAEIVEMHHKNKVDAPSGTAMRLAEVVARAKGLDLADAMHGRSGRVGARPTDQIGVMALRGGDVVGDHTLVLAGPGERIELTHRAHDRDIFARGALLAAHWVARRAPGQYDMGDVLGLRD